MKKSGLICLFVVILLITVNTGVSYADDNANLIDDNSAEETNTEAVVESTTGAVITAIITKPSEVEEPVDVYEIITDRKRIGSIIDEICKERGVPTEIVKGMAQRETTMIQWYSDGTPMLSYTGNYVGLMQVAANAGYDYEELKNNIYYNINAGIDILFSKWDMSIYNNSVPRFETMDKSIIEDWYFAIWAYNGWASSNNPNSHSNVYQEGVFDLSRRIYENEISYVDTSYLPAYGLPAKHLILPDVEVEHVSKSFIDESVFDDLENNWAKDIILAMHKEGYVNGVGDNCFNPNGNIRIDEFLCVLSRYLNLSMTDGYNNRFTSDIQNWAGESVYDLDSNNLMGDFNDDTDFSIPITRGQVVNILADYLRQNEKYAEYIDLSGIRDFDFYRSDIPVSISAEDMENIKILYAANIITGRNENIYAYNSELTRAEAAAIIYKLINNLK